MLIAPEELAARLDEPALRVFDATVLLDRPPEGGPVSVVVYSQTSVMWATRLWWLLRYFGFDDVAVLDGGEPACLVNTLDPRVFRGEGPTSYSRPGRDGSLTEWTADPALPLEVG